MKILVTGGAGFIGSHIVDALIAEGHRVVVVDNLSTGSRKNLNRNCEFYRLDIRSKNLGRLFSRVRPVVVIHHAAQMDVRYSVANPTKDANINVLGSINLFTQCGVSGVKKIIFASSGGAIYGDTPHLPTNESVLLRPASPYGIAKLAGEHYLRYTAEQSGIQWTALRYGNVYGPRQNAHGEAGVVAIFTQQLLAGKHPVINGNGKQTRDFVYVDDVVRANLLALKATRNGFYNIGTGIETDVNHVFEHIQRSLGSTARAVHGPAKKGEQQRSSLDAQLAAKVLKWKPEVPLAEGIKRTVEWFKNTV